MPSFIDIIAGKIAVAMQMISVATLNDCMKIQEQDKTKALGAILLDREFLTAEQLKIVLAKAREEQQRHDLRFAKVALSMDFITEEDLQKMRQLQESEYANVLLKTLAVDAGILTPHQAQLILDTLKTAKILVCAQCKKQYTHTAYQEGKSYQCPDCHIELETISETKSSDSFSEDIFQDTFLSSKETPKEEQVTSESQPQLILSGITKGLDMRLPEEKEDEMCGKRVQDYLILKKLGAGAMGVVYKAEQIKLRRIVALKMLSKKYSGDNFYIQRFLVEARAAAKLNHPNILQIYDVDSSEDGFFFSMEFIQGESIGKMLEQMKKIPVEKALEIGIQITQALIELYEHKIVHRDIKPDNIMLTTKGIAKLADLGLAKDTDYGKEDSGIVMGTPYYIAPEQISSPQNVDFRADIYSLGASLYHMITGIIPFLHPDIRVIFNKVMNQNLPPAATVNSTIPHSVSWLLEKMMKKNPNERYSTPMELSALLIGTKEQLYSHKGSTGPTATTLYSSDTIKIEVKEPIDTANLNFRDDKAVSVVAQPTIQKIHEDLPITPTLVRQMPKKNQETGEVKQVQPGQTPTVSKKNIDSSIPLPSKRPSLRLYLVCLSIVVAIVVISYALWPSKQETKKIPVTEEEVTKQYHLLEEQINQALQKQNLSQLKDILTETKSFQQKYANTNAAKPTKELENKILRKMESLEKQKQQVDLDKKYSDLKKGIDKLLAENNFVSTINSIDEYIKHNAVLKDKFEDLKGEVKLKAKERCDFVLQESVKLQRKLEWQQALKHLKDILDQEAKKQLPENLVVIQKYRDQCQSTFQNILKAHCILYLQEEISYPLLANNNFDKAKRNLQQVKSIKPTSQISREFVVANLSKEYPAEYADIVGSLVEDIKGIEKIGKLELLMEEAKKQKDFKKAVAAIDFDFILSDGSTIKGRISSVNTKSYEIVIKQSKGGETVKVESLTWGCKKKLLQALVREKILAQDVDTNYYLALVSIIQDNPQEAATEMDALSAEWANRLRERLANLLLSHVEELCQRKKWDEVRKTLKNFSSIYRQSKTWKLLQDYLIRTLYESLQQLPDASTKEQVCQIIREELRDYLFSVDEKVQNDLNYRNISESLNNSFKNNGCDLSENLTLEITQIDREWIIKDDIQKRHYFLIYDKGSIHVYSKGISYYYELACQH